MDQLVTFIFATSEPAEGSVGIINFHNLFHNYSKRSREWIPRNCKYVGLELGWNEERILGILKGLYCDTRVYRFRLFQILLKIQGAVNRFHVINLIQQIAFSID